MATETEIRQHVIEPMVMLYAAPRGLPNPQVALEQYIAALKPYPSAALEGGWIALRSAREMSTWPTIGEIIKAVRDWIHSNVKPEGPAKAVGKGEEAKRYPDNAVRAMATRDGQMALQHGYGRILYQHVERNGWLEGFDHAKAKAIDSEMRQQIAEMEANGDGFGGTILNMGKRRLETEHQLRTTHLRKDAAE